MEKLKLKSACQLKVDASQFKKTFKTEIIN